MKNSIFYRPDIDGLRAIAVLGVIIYHFDILFYSKKVFPGGFVGVDIFFVISGFLITRIISNKIKTNSFSVLEFYVKRIRRIVPLLFFIIMISILFFYPLLYNHSFEEYIKSLISAVLFSSNLFFYLQDSYWAESSSLKPFLHTWSLGLEEQFYIFYPLFLMYLYKNNFDKIKVLFSLAIISFLAILSFEFIDKEAIFYLIFFRIWEFIIGGSIIFINNCKSNRLMNEFFSSLGLLFILISFLFFYPKEANYYKLILPVVGTYFILFFHSEDTLTYRFLSNKVFVFIGLISYSMYLWHQPIIVYFRLESLETLTFVNKIYIFIFIFILSYFSWKFIEQPFRNKYKFSNYVIVKFYILVTIIILIILFLLLNYKSSLNEKSFLASQESVLMINNKPCRVGPCDAGDLNGNIKIAVVGDSHSSMLMSPMNDYLKNKGMVATYFTVRLDLTDEYEDAIRNIVDDKFDTIIISFNYILRTKNNYLDFSSPSNISVGRDSGGEKTIQEQESSMERIIENIKKLSKSTKYLVLIHQVPESGWHNVLMQMNKLINDRINSSNYNPTIPLYEYLKNPISLYEDRVKLVEYYLNNFQEDNVIHIKPYGLFCNSFIENYCILANNENILYWDTNHLNYEGAKILVNKLFLELEKKKSSEIDE